VSGLDAELAGIFRDEAIGRLDEMDQALLAVESGKAGADAVDALFRNAHTIKGAAGMVGFGDVSVLAHAVEDVLAVVREQRQFPQGLAAPLLRATAKLRAMITEDGQVSDDQLLDDLAASLADLTGGQASGRQPGPPAAGHPGADSPAADVPPADVPPADVPPADVPPADVPSAREPEGGPVPSRRPKAGATRPGRGGRSAQGADAVNTPPAGAPSSGARPTATRPSGARPSGARPAGAQAVGAGTAAERRPLRVPAEKLDHLLDVVSELVQFRGQLGHAIGGAAQLTSAAADTLTAGERLLDDLKDTAIALRTLPLTTITRQLPRAVRDLAREAGKDVEIVITGADTELDRVIIESLNEPLIHLLRNAILHGIEPPAEREQAGKPARGRIEFRAVPRGSLVEIVVADDGRGVSQDVLDEGRREGSLADMLARPGYSTAAKVTELAGRGVGLDAVKSYAQAMGGGIGIRGKPGRGLEVVLMLPLALALLEVLLVERDRAVYGIPLVVVREIVTVTDVLRLEGHRAIEAHGQVVPVADIAELLGGSALPLADQPPAVVITAGGSSVAAVCDRVLGAEEVVVKSLDPICGGRGRQLGTAMLGDGKIAVLLEPGQLTGGQHRRRVVAPAEAVVSGPAKILVVEDSFTVRELQRSILEAAGHPVVTARHGRDALTALAADSEIALVVTDLEMPELNGLELTRAIRADPKRSSLPVVIVTSRGSEDDRRKGMQAGADAYMAKDSFDQHALLATVSRLAGPVPR